MRTPAATRVAMRLAALVLLLVLGCTCASNEASHIRSRSRKGATVAAVASPTPAPFSSPSSSSSAAASTAAGTTSGSGSSALSSIAAASSSANTKVVLFELQTFATMKLDLCDADHKTKEGTCLRCARWRDLVAQKPLWGNDGKGTHQGQIRAALKELVKVASVYVFNPYCRVVAFYCLAEGGFINGDLGILKDDPPVIDESHFIDFQAVKSGSFFDAAQYVANLQSAASAVTVVVSKTTRSALRHAGKSLSNAGFAVVEVSKGGLTPEHFPKISQAIKGSTYRTTATSGKNAASSSNVQASGSSSSGVSTSTSAAATSSSSTKARSVDVDDVKLSIEDD